MECLWRSHVGDMEKHGRVFMAITYWSSLRSGLELGDRKWRLNCNGEIMETNYGDQNFIHYEVENTYLEHFKDRNAYGARCAMSWGHQFHLSHVGDKTLVG